MAAAQLAAGVTLLTLKVLRPRPYQLPVLNSVARFKVLVAGRRWGKTRGVGIHAALVGHGPLGPNGIRALKGAIEGGSIWWVVPSMNVTGRARWRDLKRACRGMFPSHREWRNAKNEVEHRIALPGGGEIILKSADDPDSLRGDGLDGVVVDECSLIAEAAWEEALRPALSDKQGWALFLFTTKGRTNWTWRLWLRGASPEQAADNGATSEEYPGYRQPGWESWQRPTQDAVDAGYMPQAELDDARGGPQGVGSLKFQQEYEARFVVVAGGIIDATWVRHYDPDPAGWVLDGDHPKRVRRLGCRIRATVDTAASQRKAGDRTAVCVYAITPTGDMIVLDVIARQLEAPDLPGLLHRTWLAWKVARVGVERTEAGIGLIQAAKRLGVPVVPLDPDRDKVARAELLAARMEGGNVYFPRSAPWLADCIAELVAFPDPSTHDDQVDVLAYAAWDAFDTGGGSGITLE